MGMFIYVNLAARRQNGSVELSEVGGVRETQSFSNRFDRFQYEPLPFDARFLFNDPSGKVLRRQASARRRDVAVLYERLFFHRHAESFERLFGGGISGGCFSLQQSERGQQQRARTDRTDHLLSWFKPETREPGVVFHFR